MSDKLFDNLISLAIETKHWSLAMRKHNLKNEICLRNENDYLKFRCAVVDEAKKNKEEFKKDIGLYQQNIIDFYKELSLYMNQNIDPSNPILSNIKPNDVLYYSHKINKKSKKAIMDEDIFKYLSLFMFKEDIDKFINGNWIYNLNIYFSSEKWTWKIFIKKIELLENNELDIKKNKQNKQNRQYKKFLV